MKIIHVVLETKLLKAADRAARRAKINRSTPIRDALRNYLGSPRAKESEVRDRAGFQAGRDRAEEFAVWEAEASWPCD